MAPERVEMFINLSLKKLQLDYIDLYLVHWPIGLEFHGENVFCPQDAKGNILYDKNTDIVAVWKELEKHVNSGKLKNIGISNFNENQIERIMKVATIPPANHQVCISVEYVKNVKSHFAWVLLASQELTTVFHVDAYFSSLD